MKPLKFKGQNATFAESQPEYTTLPAYNDGDAVVFCMGLSLRERIKILFTGKLWCSLLMFGKPLTPSFFTVDRVQVLGHLDEEERQARFNDEHNLRHDNQIKRVKHGNTECISVHDLKDQIK